MHTVFPCKLLTVMGHAECEAFLEAAVLALVSALLLNLAGAVAAIVLQLHTNGASEEALKRE